MAPSAPSDSPGPSPGPQARFTLGQTLLYGAGNFGAGLLFAFTNAALPLYLAGYRLPNAAIGLLSQERPPLAGLLQLAVGALSDRTRTPLGRRRPYILLGIPISVAALLALALHPPGVVVVALLVLMTSFLAIGYGPYLALMVDLVPSPQRGRVGSVLNVASTAGQLLMLWVASQFWERREAMVFWVAGGGLLLGFGLTVLGLRERAVPAGTAVEGAGEGAVEGGEGGANGNRPGETRPSVRLPSLPRLAELRPLEYARGVLRERQVARYLLATLFFWLGMGGVVPFLTRFGTQELGTDEATAFRLLMLPLLTAAVVSLPAGWLGDRFGKRRVLLVGLVLMGGSVLVGSQVRTVEQAAAALLVTGIANGLCAVLLFPLLADLIPRERAGEFTGLGAAAWELAQPLGAVAGGLAADATGSLRATLATAGLLVLVAAALLLRVRAPRRE
jgi:maltose/moltooligosaccharide transporter